MDKLRMKSHDIVEGNVAKIAALFPQCVTERLSKDGKPELAIDFDKLRAELSKDILDTNEERYQFTWPDKRSSSRLANTPTDKTLRPDIETSKDFWNTENLYIEGDNLDVLKVLRENYLGKIKMIYIDPPYNTGNDFVYNDDFAQSRDEFEQSSGLFDEDGNHVVDPMQRNTESNGRFHTDWLNMISPRLKVARDLLTEDGVIIISIDDNEIDNLCKILSEIFGEANQLGIITWQKKRKGSFLTKGIISLTEYLVAYTKNSTFFKGLFGGKANERESQPIIKRTNRISNLSFPANTVRTKIEDGVYKSGVYGDKVNPVELLNDINIKNGVIKNQFSLQAPFTWSQQMLNIKLAKGASLTINTLNFQPRVFRIYEEDSFKGFGSYINGVEIRGTNEDAYEELEMLFNIKKLFDYSKPSNLISKLVNASSYFDKNSIILDFFSGSATTAHAVMKLNVEDGGMRKFIMVQLPEETDEKSEARKAGYENICQIGEERIRRAGKKIKEELADKINEKRIKVEAISKQIEELKEKENKKKRTMFFAEEEENEINRFEEKRDSLNEEINDLETRKDSLDTGFRVLKLDSSNMEDVFYTPEDFNKTNVFNYVDNVKPDRTPLDLLFQVMPELGI